MSETLTGPSLPPADGGDWKSVAPEAAGLSAARLAEAVRHAEAHETNAPRDLLRHLTEGAFEPPPYNEIIGPTAPRGAPNGLILRHGRIVARWGDTRRVDMTFSVAKSYLSLLAGLAVADGLITDLDEPVGRTVTDGGFEGVHNGAITWRHMLQQTSEWEGMLWAKPDQIDRNRNLAAEGKARKGDARPLAAPGGYWEYNDVRVNRFSLALLRRFGRPLPEVFAERIMKPIGASADWRWEGYRNSWLAIGGRQVQSVSGGGHWGGGVFIHAEDQARVALLMQRGGEWGGRRLIDPSWIAQSLVPCPLNPAYGFMWWLNTDRAKYPAAPASSFLAIGAGGNACWIEPQSGLVAVVRWLDPPALDGFMGAVMAALD